MGRIYVPSAGPESWRSFLADPEKHWKTGYSAHTLAHCWEAAIGLPKEIANLFDGEAKLQLAIPEHKVSLPGGSTQSQSDIFAFLTIGSRTCATTIEGKVNETFGPTIAEWQANITAGKQERLAYMAKLLGLAAAPSDVRYQLMHRTASAVIEAERFKTDEAAMIVHSFSPTRMWFDDFAKFLSLFKVQAEPDRCFTVSLPTGRPLHLAWACGDQTFLNM
jgi:hypothetical protein